MNSFDTAIANILAATELESNAELQKALGISRQAFSNARKRGAVPSSWKKKILDKFGLDLNAEALDGENAIEFHKRLSKKVRSMTGLSQEVMSEVLRYGENSLEGRFASTAFDLVLKIRDRLDERAYIECESLPKDKRLSLYYGSEPLDEAPPKGVKRLGPITQAVDDIEKALDGVDDATILNAALKKLTQMRNQAVHGIDLGNGLTFVSDEDSGDACGIDKAPPTDMIQFMTPGSGRKLRIRNKESND